MYVLLFLALAFPLGCLALLSLAVLLGLFAVAAVLRGVGAIKASLKGRPGSYSLGRLPNVKLADNPAAHFHPGNLSGRHLP
jgi:hypothetical protein